MCGILGVVATSPVNQLLYDGLQVLQHRGQDAAGIATSEGGRFHMHKGSGLVRDVFRTRNMRSLTGQWGIGHCRYPTAGSAYNPAEAQPFYVNSPFGLMLAHNGNLTNSDQLKQDMFLQDLRHMNTNSDSEILLNVLAHELQAASTQYQVDAETIFKAVAGVYRRVRGAYAVVVMIAGYGLLAFRDPYGIRPLVIGKNDTPEGTEYLVASESVAIDTLGFKMLRDVAPGEAVLIDLRGNFLSRQCAEHTVHAPCMFEFVYLARPDSLMDGISVYETRAKMGEFLADKIRLTLPHLKIDAVMPIPDSSRPAAMELARRLDLQYREGFVKNRYIGRTFIMPGHATRRKSVRQKLNAIAQEFKGKNVLLVDDSIVRGTTSREIINMAREAGATKVYFASASPPVRFANVYGIDMPSRSELIAAFRDDDEICREIGADVLIYQDIDALRAAVRAVNPAVTQFETSCFDGHYVTGDISPAYLKHMEDRRDAPVDDQDDDGYEVDGSGGQLDLNLVSSE
ncbi:MAG: amidophosphoribosyltransferase [Rhodocyclaceae bacterium]|nr:amidophosphoribosyltransferase [Rhodocyclaceae bacterium]MBK9623105.1 amidophosphoribosyltransferase [Rhodocyclaceae bacterium]MBL0075628.1 amidophosphoribosyltransferase [Rhodocyclaceae bacterium]MBP6108623.1 amidophosphoribosyltransferase [Rhodocyclaceae bacterium]MBP6278453.1 amidophosphoribosyltransferase [Rhodocyclaceae bacterium]